MSAQPPRPPDPPASNGRVLGWISAAKGLTVTNALVILLLLLGLVPAYIVYQALDNPEILDRFMSSYRVLKSPGSCILRQARQRGEPYIWSLNTGFAFEGGSRWSVGVILENEPDEDAQKSYCATLMLIVDYLHGAKDAELPGIVWQYKDIEGREGQKGDR